MDAPMTVDEALRHEGPLVAVWDHVSDDPEWLGIYAAASGRMQLLAHTRVPTAQKDATTADLRRRGVRIGATCGASPFLWSKDRGFTVWSLSAVVADGAGPELKLGDGRVVRVADAARVVSFLDEDSLGHRGVKVELKDGSHVVVVEEDHPAYQLDPTYSMDNVMIDAAWATYLGRDLASWLDVPHRDELP
jgi:hypothetical protein